MQPDRRFRLLAWRTTAIVLVASVACLGWWWVTWPDRTIDQFERFINAGDYAAANKLIVHPDPNFIRSRDDAVRFFDSAGYSHGHSYSLLDLDIFWDQIRPVRVQRQPRDLDDLVMARRTINAFWKAERDRIRRRDEDL